MKREPFEFTSSLRGQTDGLVNIDGKQWLVVLEGAGGTVGGSVCSGNAFCIALHASLRCVVWLEQSLVELLTGIESRS